MTDKARLAALEAVAMALVRHIEGDSVTRDLITDDEWAGYLSDADYVSGLISAAGYAVGRDWQPISTAPKDGTRFIAWWQPCPQLPAGGWQECQWHGEAWHHPFFSEPTHWMPPPVDGPHLAASEPTR